jgi:hypothetical protein
VLDIWLRLRQSIVDLTNEKSDGCIVWSHRVFLEISRARYAVHKEHCHILMAKYFGDLIPANIRQERLMLPMPLKFSEGLIWFDEKCEINMRRVMEAPNHLINAGIVRVSYCLTCYTENCPAIYTSIHNAVVHVITAMNSYPIL